MQDLFTQPLSIEAEQALVSAVIANNKALEKVEEFLRPEHFSDSLYALIYKSARNLIERGRLADPITLKNLIASELGESEQKNIDEQLNKMAIMGLSIINIEDYGRIIFDRYLRRQLIDLGQEIGSDAAKIDLDNSAIDQIETAEKKLYDLGAVGLMDGGPQDLTYALTEVLKNAERAMKNPDGISGVPTGLRNLDKMMGGFHNSDLLVLAGRPGMGKTSIAMNIAFNIARYFEQRNAKGEDRKSVAFFSLEMSASQLAARILSSEANVSSHSMRTGKLKASELNQLVATVSDFNKLPLYIDDTAGITMGAIRTRARRMKRDKGKGLGFIVIDYIQLISGSGRSSDNRVQELSEITRQLKMLAKDLDIPVLALSQLSRKVEDRDEKIPQLSDLRESGSIEQDADSVMFIYREEYYLENKKLEQRANEATDKFMERKIRLEKDKEKAQNKAELIIAKQRHGPTGSVDLFFDRNLTKFYSLEEDDYLPAQAV